MFAYKRLFRPRLVLAAALFIAVSAAAIAACRTTPDQVTPPNPESTPEETPGAAERASLGSIHTQPSVPPDRSDAGLLFPEGNAVASAIDAEKARLAAADAADAGMAIDAGAPSSGSSAPPDAAQDAASSGAVATLVFSAGISGELVPCGCSPDLRGGLPRAASLLAQWRAKEPGLVYLDAGDLLFAADNAPSGPGARQLELKARALAQGAALLGAAARVVGARDLAAGGKFVSETAAGIPLLDAGAEAPGARATLLVKAGPAGVPVGIFAAGLGADPAKTIEMRAAALRKDGARLVVLLFHPQGDRALSAAQRILTAARAAGVDLVLLAHRDDPATDPDLGEPGAPPLLALEGHMQSLLKLELTIPPGVAPGAPVWMPKSEEEKKADAKALEQRVQLLRARMASAPAELKPQIEAKIAELQARGTEASSAVDSPPAGSIIARAEFRPLSLELPDDAAAKALVASYDKEVADENLAAAKKLPAECPRAKKGESSFIGVSAIAAKGESCAGCHASEVAFWARTRHARAYETLVIKGKQFSFDCIACHTTGWQQPGGVCRIDRTASGGPGIATPADRTGAGFNDPLPKTIAQGRQGVQCEDCHGPASEHAKTGGEITEEVTEVTCRRCHDPENSPHFDFKTYRPWVVGPGHGAPLADGATPQTAGEIKAGNKLGPNPALHKASEGN